MDEETLEEVKNVYNLVVEVGTHPVSTIKTAEAIKVVENSQRDINIAFMNDWLWFLIVWELTQMKWLME